MAKWTGLELLIHDLVFATELNCGYPGNENWTCLQRTICRQVYPPSHPPPHVLITFLFYYLGSWRVRGEVKCLLK
ncbi:rCG50883, isoform CRA_a [Rattus norvegicus]|uniref:RCG50883, isoform CRA_a n=1 Tax=Rattus norvegicus TaxID=10116 RepID=A6KJ53_RAT|nr:rCG50883, isoform CRA_a [Rattus norvegicus]EDL96775.1 rCG50883, isoform CRA_a [Rattus norvegicus]